MDNKNFSPSFSPIGDLLYRSFKIFKEKFYVFLGVISFPLIFSILFYFVQLSYRNLILYLPVFIVSVIVSYWSNLTCLYVIKDRGEKIGVRESFKRAWFKLFPYFWIIILAILASLGGFILLIIPGIIVGVSLIFVPFILMSEDLRGMDVLLKSRHLVKGRWWPVFGRWLLIVVLASSIIIGLRFVIFPLLFFLIGTANFNFFLSQQNLSFILFILFFEVLILFVSLILSCFVNIYCFLVYEDLKRLKEGAPFDKKEGRKKYLILIFITLACLILLSFFVIVKGKGEGQKHFNQKRLKETFKQLQLKEEEEVHKKQEESQIEDWSLYKEITDEEDRWVGTGPDVLCGDKEFEDVIIKAKGGTMKILKLNDALNLVITPNYKNWTTEEFTAFNYDPTAICGAGGRYPAYAYEDKLLWVGVCSTGFMPIDESEKERLIRCEKAQEIVKNFFVKKKSADIVINIIADGKTYRNEENGFELKYPKDWEMKGEGREIFIGAPYWREDMPEGGSVLFIKIRNISLQDFIKEYEKPEYGERIIHQEEYFLDSERGVKLTATTALGVDTDFIFLIKNNNSYIIDFYDFDPFHQAIISTFKFIEEK